MFYINLASDAYREKAKEKVPIRERRPRYRTSKQQRGFVRCYYL